MAVGRQSAIVVANSVLGAAQGFALIFLVARYLGDEVLGARAFALSLVAILGIVCRLGFPTTHAFRLARGEDRAGTNGTYLALKLGLTGAFAVLGLAAWALWFRGLDKPATDTTSTALLVAYLLVIVQSLRDFPLSTFRGERRILQREAVLFTNTLVTLALTAWVCLAYAQQHGRWIPLEPLLGPVAMAFGDTHMTATDAIHWSLGAFLAGDVAALAVAVVLFVRLRMPLGRPSAAVARAFLVATLPLMLLSVSGAIASRISQVLLGFFADARTLGHFAGAAKLSDGLLLLSSGVMVVLLPAVSRLDAEGRRPELGMLVLQAERWVSLLGWPVALGAALAPKPALHVALSDEFLAAAPLLSILCLHTLLVSIRMPLQTKALGLGKHHFAARVAAGALAATLLLDLVLIPDRLGPVPMAGLGGLGAALATLAAGVVPLVAYRRKAHEWTGHPLFSVHLRKHLAAAAATFGLFRWALPQLAVDVRIWELAAYGLAIAGVYALLLVLLRELRRSDLGRVRALLGGSKATEAA